MRHQAGSARNWHIILVCIPDQVRKRVDTMKKGAIVLVDDDPDDHHIIQHVLSELEYPNQLISFTESEKAYLYLASHLQEQPFIILCDINMPRMNGIELKRKIDSNPELRKKSIPFVYLSTAASPKTISEAFELNVQGFFIKPYDVKRIRATLKLIVDYWSECKHPNN
jgi:CheY-like chemotaxis protein